ncbi:hypothetical protein P7C73_g2746, partial [Tremellales sp. Uapishka_1]
MTRRDPALGQLLEMGIPGGRAAAALKRSKGDVMSAAERVFAGEFDDISSDDEGDYESSGSWLKPENLQEDVIPDIDVDSEEDFDDGFDADELDETEQLHSDPYAGVFFSKDRVEQIVEPSEKEEWATIVPCGKKGARKLKVRVLGKQEWMSGCPEGNEQSFLFQLYSLLEEAEVGCSSNCGHVFKKYKSDFFALFPEFSTYTAHLASIICPTCPKCHAATCLACGRGPNSTTSRYDLKAFQEKGGVEGQERDDDIGELDVLLHCLNVQGVIVGVGLQMLEKAFALPKTMQSPQSPPRKKQRPNVSDKLEVVNNQMANLASGSDDEDNSDGFSAVFAKASGSGPKTKGVGYSGNDTEDRSGQAKAEREQQAADEKTSQLLAQVRTYLPSINRKSGSRTSDHLVHPTTIAHLRRRSGFVNDLLRNDSLVDMSNRGSLYRALFDWLEIVSRHEALASMMAMPQMRPTNRKTVTAKKGVTEIQVTYEGSPSPRELLENCVIQARAALRGLEATSVPPEGEEDEFEELTMSLEDKAERERERVAEEKLDENCQLKEFCNRIIACADAIDKSLSEVKGKGFVQRMRDELPKLPDAGTLVQSLENLDASEATRKSLYEEWAKRARFQYCDMRANDDQENYRHAYNDQIKGLAQVDAPKRSLAIAKELAILTTSLPVGWNSTIFLRVDEARVDCLKAMIVGSEGTPYENGCFIFDIFLPMEYNHLCPLVKSMTTNGGTYRYNPNLYADGKVCLSLLGTWSGPGWIGGQSTLLQVLISLQSLILCEEPYLNEPGERDLCWAGSRIDASRRLGKLWRGKGHLWSSNYSLHCHGGWLQSQASRSYSANVRRMVVDDAMGHILKDPPFPFENEIKTHFRLKANAIREQLDKWKQMDDGKPIISQNPGRSEAASSTGETAFDKSSAVLRRLLDELDCGEKKAAMEMNGRTKNKGEKKK